MRRAVHRLGDRLAHLLDLVHQRRLRVKAAGGVDEEEIGAGFFGFRRRFEGHRARIRAFLALARPRRSTRLPQTSSC